MWLLLVSVGSILAALSNISLKYGLAQVNALLPEDPSVLQRIPYLVSNLYLWLGLVGLGTAFFFWIAGLSQVKLSHAYPIFVGLEYSLVMVLSWLILGEALVSIKLAGIGLVFLGIIIILF